MWTRRRLRDSLLGGSDALMLPPLGQVEPGYLWPLWRKLSAQEVAELQRDSCFDSCFSSVPATDYRPCVVFSSGWSADNGKGVENAESYHEAVLPQGVADGHRKRSCQHHRGASGAFYDWPETSILQHCQRHSPSLCGARGRFPRER